MSFIATNDELAGSGSGTLPMPFYIPSPGIYDNHPTALNVTIATNQSGATLRYTINNTNPTLSNGTVINNTSGGVVLPTNSFINLKSITILSGATSAVKTGSYEINA